ncbi:HlyC/CorC family transporter [Propioniciclava coleopterorum]|uniref:HlyC/CorC family transporter n=1 Tax=Propioniciclava coleopterorum TaxID=2714937 RepID=A0A6G7Y8M8_9ACTN|nr:HlyC/CorC family transporter [Propioniciclava coleopterorum]
MNATVSNVLLVFLFILIGGVFAAAEMALVSLRDSQVKSLAGRGKRGQTVARLAADPNLFLSAVQIGVTLAGFLSASFGAANLAPELAPILVGWGLPEAVAGGLSLVLITVAISYFSIVLGELAAKRLAMQRAEAFALTLGPLVNVIAKIARPVIWFLGVSTNLVVRVLGGDPKASREEVTDEELRAMVSSSVTLGDEERHIVDEVFAAGQVTLREAMVPRTEVDFLDGDMPASKAIRVVRDGAHSRYPVVGRDVDDVIGFLHVRDLFDLDPAARQAPISQLVRPIHSLPGTVRILHALSEMQAQGDHMVIVTDEYGGTAGIVTIEDLIEELIGDITDEFDREEPAQHATDLDGLTTLEEFAETYGHLIPEGPYDTVAGYVMAELGQLPDEGDSVTRLLFAEHGGEEETGQEFAFTVTELDGRRVARLRLDRLGALRHEPASD